VHIAALPGLRRHPRPLDAEIGALALGKLENKAARTG
jgi:hypothetical protein